LAAAIQRKALAVAVRALVAAAKASVAATRAEAGITFSASITKKLVYTFRVIPARHFLKDAAFCSFCGAEHQIC